MTELRRIPVQNGRDFKGCFPKQGNNNDSTAVVVRNGNVHYKKGVPVLQNLNITVQKGTIYSLLGSSGCGKTTTLSCIVGVRKLNQGDIWVFGSRPGEQGKRVGYMPQETSLFRDFSISETLSYFGTLYGMSIGAVTRKATFLTELLSLPESSRRVGTLSGGQKRRVSFAVALIHDPGLLVLDEPTVGVDPLLRESIWKHLLWLSRERGVTVLNTTHYIDEAKDSTTIGVLRGGRLLVEQNPTELLDLFETTSLENVVLRICRAEADERMPSGQLHEMRRLSLGVKAPDISTYKPRHIEVNTRTRISDSLTRIRSLVHKNFAVLFRNLLLLFFTVFAPSILVCSTCITFMHDPQDLPFGVVNLEVANNSICSLRGTRVVGECNVEHLSCKFIEGIPPGAINLEYYRTEKDAVEQVHKGFIWGYMLFPENFSAVSYERAASGAANVDDAALSSSEIIVKMDQTNNNVVYRLKKLLVDRLQDYGKEILRDCGFDERQAEFSLNYKTPIFGRVDTKFVDYIAPSIAIANIVVSSTSL